MAEDERKPETAEAEPKTPEEGPKIPAGCEGDGAAAGAEAESEATDRHGMPGINREKYNRDMRAKDDKIAELQAQLDERSKTEEGRAALKAEMDQLKADMADERVTYELRLAGIRDDVAAKAAKAILPDYEGDVSKLKEDCPYLFSETRQTGSTGLKPEGGAGEGIDAKLDKVFGVED